MKVLKFGGSSVATPDRIRSVIEIVRPRLSEPVALVFSAFGGVTDLLIKAGSEALASDDAYRETLASIEKRHIEAAQQLLNISTQASAISQVKVTLNELEDVLHGVYLVRERTPRTLDYLMSFGERLSAFIISNAFRDAGIPAEYLDARQVIVTDSNFGYARVDFETTNQKIKTWFDTHPTLQVITGFIATSQSGETTTLGRSGSDYTAAIFAAALQASDLEIWTDVDGMMTADPRIVHKAFSVPEMTYEEAMELSHFGAKVIFPATMQPAMINRIPVWIKNTFNPEFRGTVIKSSAAASQSIKGISTLKGISLLSLQGSGLLGVVGAASRLFSALAARNINVILISQASSEHSICLAIDQLQVDAAIEAIRKEFQYEMKSDEVEIRTERKLAILAVVGDGMKHQPGTSGRMFRALGKNGVNVMAIAQGSSERNISAVIGEEDMSKAVNALHDAFFLSDRRIIHLYLVGTGLIGKTLIQMITEELTHLADRLKLEIHLAGVANSRKMLFASTTNLDLESVADKLMNSGVPMDAEAFVAHMQAMNRPNSIFVDCTSSEVIAGLYQTILESSISIVTPNKKANSGSMDRYNTLRKTAFSRGVRFLYETNVGAGLPVINTLNDLLLSGDKIIRIEAVLSGTLNFIFSTYDGSRPFSEVVRQARELGYTEPDPRDDLNGMDVARKALILSRESGAELELESIDTHNLVPEDCRTVASTEEFLTKLALHDSYYLDLYEKALAKGEKLRYMAVIQNGSASCKLGSIPASHPFYSLSGSDNIILLTTERYHERPMVIRGPGAGADVTAAGVFADIIRIGNEIR